MEKIFYTREVASMLGFSLHQLNYWARESMHYPRKNIKEVQTGGPQQCD